MFRIGVITICGAWALTMSVVAAPVAAGVQVGRLGPDRPNEPGFQPAREVFECAFRDTVNTAALDTLRGDTTGGTSLVDGYSCRAWTETGPEHVNRLEVPSRVEFSARLAGLAGVLDVILLGACDTESCLAQENTGFTLILEPGDYVLVIDGYQGAEGPYTLLMTARTPGVPPQVCAEGGAVPVSPAEGNLTLDGNLFGREDRIQAYPPCSDLWHLGGESWYAVTLPPADAGGARRVTLTATAAAPALDLALWVFDGCGETAGCLEFADDSVAGGAETAILTNAGELPRVVYLAVDAFRPPATEDAGGYSIEVSVAVPTERSNLGDIRAGFH